VVTVHPQDLKSITSHTLSHLTARMIGHFVMRPLEENLGMNVMQVEAIIL